MFFALTMAAIGISQSSTFAPDSSKAKVAAASIFGIIDRKSKIDSSDESGTVLENVKGDIELRHISFTYPARPDIQIFRHLCLTIRAGKVNRPLDQYMILSLKNFLSHNFLISLIMCLLIIFTDRCFGRRKRVREINSDLSVTKILRSGFWTYNS